MPKRGTTRSSQNPVVLKELQDLTVAAGLSPSQVIPLLRKASRLLPDAPRALRNCHRFLSAGFTSSLLRDFIDHPVLLEIFLRLASQSQYLTDILVRSPELLRWLTTTGELSATKDASRYRREAEEAVAPFERKERKLNALRRFHRREILRLGAREILQEAAGPVVGEELAHLADAVLECVLRFAIDDLAQKSGRPVNPGLAIIGLGKLGGQELNFSSDIDLMFVYQTDGSVSLGSEGIQTYHALCVRLAEQVVRTLSEHTEEGYFYRVDLRLRPEGQSGPLAMSRSAYFSYYEARGELWERQMLLKARHVAGNPTVGEGFLSDIRPFVFPRARLQSPLEEIAAIKRKIEQKIGERENIKLGAGGIRDVEFIVQALQLLHAGGMPGLRVRSTIGALERLTAGGLMSRREMASLMRAYVFLRRVEHRLQLLEGRQTHSLPATAAETAALARRLDYKGEKEFRRELAKHQQRIRRSFESVFGVKRHPAPARGSGRKIEIPVGEHRRMIEDAFPGLTENAAFRDSLLRTGAVNWCLRNLAALADTVYIRRTLAQGFQNNRFLDLVIRSCARSRWLSTLMAREPLFIETLAARPEEFLQEGQGWKFLLQNDLARFKAFNEAKAVVRYILGERHVDGLLREVTEVAETILHHVISAEKPDGTDVRRTLAVMALGKFGGRELTLGSDLDLVFVRRETMDGEEVAAAEVRSRHLLKELKGETDVLYSVDLRLRPEGRNAPVVCDLPYLDSYFDSRAELWERQSLLKARVTGGDGEFREALEAMVVRRAYVDALPARWTEEIVQMRERIERDRRKAKPGELDLKTCEGGLLDLEFSAQMLQLRFGQSTVEIRTPNTIDAFNRLRSAGILSAPQAATALKNYSWLRSFELFLRMNGSERGFVWPSRGDVRQPVTAALGEKSEIVFRKRIEKVRAENRKLFQEAVRICRK